jgi:hypothetical protein
MGMCTYIFALRISSRKRNGWIASNWFFRDGAGDLSWSHTRTYTTCEDETFRSSGVGETEERHSI